MTKTAHKGQEKKVVGASLANVGEGIFGLRLKFSDDSNCAVGVPAKEIDNLIGQAETAIADEQLIFTATNGRRFVCELSALRQIKTLLCSILGGSDAHVLDSSANAQLTKGATRTGGGAKQISEASAQAVRPKQPRTSSTRGGRSLPARQFNNHPKNGRRANAGSKSPAAAAATERPLRLKGRRPLRQLPCANESIPSSGVMGSSRKSRAVRCNPCGASILMKNEELRMNKSSFSPRVKTKHGRTSVVVATRKVS